jgi:hypothetical protein
MRQLGGVEMIDAHNNVSMAGKILTLEEVRIVPGTNSWGENNERILATGAVQGCISDRLAVNPTARYMRL